MAFTALDILVILLVGAGLVFGWLRGFVAELLSLFAWFLAILALRLLHAPVADVLEGVVGTESGAAVLAFVLVFGLVFFAGKLASRRVGARVRDSVIGPLDRVLGAGLRRGQGADRHHLALPGLQPGLRHDLRPPRGAARMGPQFDDLQPAEIERRHRRRPGRGAARARSRCE